MSTHVKTKDKKEEVVKIRAGALSYICSVLWVMLWSVSSSVSYAAPISGGLELNFATQSATCGVDADGDTFVDEDPPNGVDDDGDTVLDEDDCSKIDLTEIKFEADFILELSLSGLTVSSVSVFTLKGLEYQAFTITAAFSALSIKSILIFAPSITEIEIVRNADTLAPRYCVRASAPGSIVPPFLNCPSPDARLYWLMEDVGVYHPAVANLILARIFDEGGMLDADIIFRKKVFDLSLVIAGLHFGLRAMFANLGTAPAPNFRAGLILAIEGQTVSGLLVRSETWFGARQGLECFSECKPLERLYGGIVVDEFNFQEEKIFIRNLTIAGVTFNVRAEFRFSSEPGALCENSVICFVEVQTHAPVQPLNLVFTNTLRLGPTLQTTFDYLITSFKIGDISATAIWYFFVSSVGAWQAQLTEIIGAFDPPGARVSSDLKLCPGSVLTLCSSGILKHTLSISTTLGSFSWDARIIFVGGLIKNFYQLWLDTTWTLGFVQLKNSVVISAEFLNALAFGVEVRF